MEEDKKTERKRKRFAVRLKTYKGIISTDVPQPSLVLYNAGQATGLEKEIIIKMIKDNSVNVTTPKLIADKGESHSFLMFSSIEEAALFLNKCNGKAKIDESGSPLYASFVENVPNNEIICPHNNPKDLTLLNDFISNGEEIKFISEFDWTEDEDSSKLKNRQVRHYGYEFRYGTNDVDLNDPLNEKIPELCNVLWHRLKENGFDLGVPNQLTVNKYRPGEGIPSHVDKHSPFGETILSLSLGSSVVMDWRHHTGKYVPIVVQARSMMIMQGEARYDWQHGIQARNWDPIIENRETSNSTVKVVTTDTKPRKTRISLTFRWTRDGPCMCLYKTLCDSASKLTTGIEGELATNLEELHVHQVYEQIAEHFSTTRHKPWPKVVQFMSNVPTGSVVVDLGCGNGKNVSMRDDIVQIAGERSNGLLSECKHHTRAVPGADCVRLCLLQAGLKDECADVAICIAVIHHFCSEARRLQAISTITRLLKPGGRALITVWAKDQTKSNYLCRSKDQVLNNEVVTVGGLNLPVHENRTQFQHKDLLVPWKLRKIKGNKLADGPDQTLLRYYHVFEENELTELCNQIPNVSIENSFYEEGNWCVILNKML